MVLICKQCNKKFNNSHKSVKYCSRLCYGNSMLGNIPWNKGKKMPEHCCFKIGHTGYRNKESYDNSNKSFFDTREYRGKIKRIAKEKRYGLWMIGRKMPEKTRLAIRKANLGRKKENPLTPENKRIRCGLQFKKWRIAVFERDKYTCQHCGIKNKKGLGKTVELNPHHIKPFSLFPELRFDILNGITLCRECHQKTESWGRPKAFYSDKPDVKLTIVQQGNKYKPPKLRKVKYSTI